MIIEKSNINFIKSIKDYYDKTDYDNDGNRI